VCSHASARPSRRRAGVVAMAVRIVYVPLTEGDALVAECPIEFRWVPGQAISRQRMSRQSLHEAAIAAGFPTPILDISTYSGAELGIALTAFNLPSKWGVPVECVYESSKVFEHGGPFHDLRDSDPSKAKRDPRLRSSGALTGYELDGERWPPSPPNYFHAWLYLNALVAQPRLAEQLSAYGSFTDLGYAPKNEYDEPTCSAEAAVLYAALRRRGMAERVLASRKALHALLRTPWCLRYDEPVPSWPPTGVRELALSSASP